jgi:ketosteroid isomerase-like protein
MVHETWALAAARDGMAAMNRRDWAAFESLYAPNVVFERPDAPPIVGRDAVRRYYEEFVAVVPDHRESELRMIENDCAANWAIFSYVETGTWPRQYSTKRAKGSPFVVHTTTFVRFDHNGRAARLRNAYT